MNKKASKSKTPKKQKKEIQKVESLPAEEVKITEELIEKHIELMFSSHRGPLPRPSDFKEYEDVLPGAADRILKMAEEMTYCETKVVQAKVKQDGRDTLSSLILAFLLAVLVLLIAFYSIQKGRV